MEFHSFIFLIFFSVFLLIYQQVPSTLKRHWILACSYFFYAWWNPWYLGLILLSSAVDFWCSRYMAQSGKSLKTLLLALSLLVNIGILFSFKYAKWLFVDLGSLNSFSFLNEVLLPVGISFYTFQTLSYTIDVYRGIQKPEKSWITFALFVSFFPQLVAGPIERAGSLLPQLNNLQKIQPQQLGSGLMLMLWGFFKKLVIADKVAIYSDAYFNISTPPQDALWAGFATLSFGIQILFDFSAYTDIARGAARCIGLDLMENFKSPYGAKGMREFWSRWHISLSTWFRDYFYIALGGNRKSEMRIQLNLLLTFLLSGLWHGANTTFFIWGLLHGIFYLIERTAGKFRLHSPVFLKWFLTFTGVQLAWIFFRSESMVQALSTLSALTHFNLPQVREIWLGLVSLEPAMIKDLLSFCLTFGFTISALYVDHQRHFSSAFDFRQWSLRKKAIVSVFLIYLILFAGAFEKSTFIYFQF